MITEKSLRKLLKKEQFVNKFFVYHIYHCALKHTSGNRAICLVAVAVVLP